MGLLAATALFLALATVVVFAETPVITAPVAADKLQTDTFILLDIRTPEEWAETGIAAGALPVSMHTSDFPAQLQALLSRYRPDQIGLICATGGRSGYVTNVLAQNGITGVQDVSEGMFGNGTDAGWIARGLPVVPLPEAKAELDRLKAQWD